MRSVRHVFIAIETVTLLLIVAFIVLQISLLRVYIRGEHLNNQASDIRKVDITIEDYVRSAKQNFENYLLLPQKNEALPLLHDLSDVYRVNSALAIETIYKSGPRSRIFPGYDLSRSHLGGLLRAVQDEKVHASRIVRSTENEELSFYVYQARGAAYHAGRIDLDKIRSNLIRLAEYTESIILLASKDGFVLSSTADRFSLSVLPVTSKRLLRIQEVEYLFTRQPSLVFENDIVILTPVTTVYRLLKSPVLQGVLLALFVLVVVLLKIHWHTRQFFEPLRKFSGFLRDWEVGREHPGLPQRFLAYSEIGQVYQNFLAKTRVIQDLFQRLKQEEQSMNQMRLHLKNIIDSMPSMLIAIDASGGIHEWNQAASEFTGVSADDALGKVLWEVFPALSKYQADCAEILRDRRRKQYDKEILPGGPGRFFNLSIFPLAQEGLHEIGIRLDDVTDLERAEQQLRQAQKLESIGALVGGVAHDFNNILSVILGNLSLMRSDLELAHQIPAETLEEYIGAIETSSQRATDMIKHLLLLARKQELTLTAVNLNAIARQMIDICGGTFDKRVEIAARLSEEVLTIEADAGQIEQVLLNLAINAMHAMTLMRRDGETHGGTLTISTGKIVAGKSFCAKHIEAVPQAVYCVLDVRDTGVGMDPGTVARIFDPFFSTKEKGKGTGLGLTMVENIVRQHKGLIEVQSEPGKGSEFRIYFPASRKDAASAAALSPTPIPSGKGTILIVDDEDQYRAITRRMLQNRGYTVMLAENGMKGIELYEKHHREIDLVLLDINMPKLSGADTFKRLKEIHPGIKAIVASGFIQDENADRLLALGAKRFIQKPFTLAQLIQTVTEISDGTSS